LAYQPLPPAEDAVALRAAFDVQHHRVDEIIRALVARLQRLDIGYRVIGSDYDQDTLVAPLSHKLAATRAGLGWVGRSSLLITPQYGPRVRLATVLVDVELPAGTPSERSRCGSCRACVEACPDGLITGAAWRPSTRREDLLDAFGCRSARAERPGPDGRPDACARCLIACPVGAG
jgi:epoxyqueuosine reductase QueG